ncbi:DinB family protein [Peribacillus sp. SCS-37]|uniref:DinB family protein n=1 Tax=Paraperibacillus esterisolvens TaxID=3115296 RepID=UPI003905D4C2
MGKEREIISYFSTYSSWLDTLRGIDETLWSMPVAEGKWAVSEIIAHIKNWDDHLLLNVIPSVCSGMGMDFPEFDSFNENASMYAKSGISQTHLLNESMTSRERLVQKLSELSAETLHTSTTANGVLHCPHTGTPYSLIYIVKEFTDHDIHHKNQITEFLNEKSLQ